MTGEVTEFYTTRFASELHRISGGEECVCVTIVSTNIIAPTRSTFDVEDIFIIFCTRWRGESYQEKQKNKKKRRKKKRKEEVETKKMTKQKNRGTCT
jgi:hypothetical protein